MATPTATRTAERLPLATSMATALTDIGTASIRKRRGWCWFGGRACGLRARATDSSVLRFGAGAAQTINGGAFDDFLWGGGRNDVLQGRGGGDLLEGSSGSNTAAYTNAPIGLTANLSSPALNTGDAAGDAYFNISAIEGSSFSDVLTGNSKANRIIGGAGLDKLRGGKNKDTFALRRSDESKPGAANRDQILDFNARHGFDGR